MILAAHYFFGVELPIPWLALPVVVAAIGNPLLERFTGTFRDRQALGNLRSGYKWKLVERASMRLDAGFDNLTNRQYVLPLGGRYWVDDKTGNSSVPGMGRSLYSGVTFEF